MMKKYFSIIFLILVLTKTVGAYENLKNIYMPFIKNVGQLDSKVAFYASFSKGIVFIKKNGEITYGLLDNSIKESFLNTKNTSAQGLDSVITKVNVIKGNDYNQWKFDVPCFEKVLFKEIYRGISLSLKVKPQGIEKVFNVNPGSEPEKIKGRFHGAQTLSLDSDGNLFVKYDKGYLMFSKPIAFQVIGSKKRFVPINYRINEKDYCFVIGEYDKTKPLVIDPLLGASYMGGSLLESAFDVAVDNGTGIVYVVGATNSSNFPVTVGSYDVSYGSNQDAFIVAFNRGLNAVQSATFLGGSGSELAKAVKVDISGNVYIIWIHNFI